MIQIILRRSALLLLAAFPLVFCATYSLDILWPLTLFRGVMLAVVALFLLSFGRDLVKLLDPFAFLLLFLLLLGAANGLTNEGTWATYIRHGFQYSFLLAFYLFGRSIASEGLPPKQLKIIGAVILLAYIFPAVSYFPYDPTLSFQPNATLLPLAAGIVIGPWFSSAAAVVLVALGNKRAVLLGACFIAAIIIAVSVVPAETRLQWLKTALIIAVLTPLLTVASGFALSQAPRIGLPEFALGTRMASTTSSSSATSATSATSANVLRLTSARDVEAKAVLAELDKAPWGVALGIGFGATIPLSYLSPGSGARVQYVSEMADVMPTQIALTSGAPLAILLTGLLLGAGCVMLLRIRETTGVDRVITLFALGLIPDILLGFNATNPLIWSAFGYAWSVRRYGVSICDPFSYTRSPAE